MPSEKDVRLGGDTTYCKSVIDALSLGLLNLGNSNSLLRTMSEMNATGMQLKSIPGCAGEGIIYPQSTLFPEVRATYQRRQTFYKSASRLS